MMSVYRMTARAVSLRKTIHSKGIQGTDRRETGKEEGVLMEVIG